MSGIVKQFMGEDSSIDKDAMIEKMKQFCGGDSPIDKDAMMQKMQNMCCPVPEKSGEKLAPGVMGDRDNWHPSPFF